MDQKTCPKQDVVQTRLQQLQEELSKTSDIKRKEQIKDEYMHLMECSSRYSPQLMKYLVSQISIRQRLVTSKHSLEELKTLLITLEEQRTQLCALTTDDPVRCIALKENYLLTLEIYDQTEMIRYNI